MMQTYKGIFGYNPTKKKPTKAVLRPFEVREITAENDLKLNHA